MDFIRLFRLIARHKWLLLAVVTIATAGTYAGARFKGVAYQATATLMPQQGSVDPLGGLAAVSSSLGNQQTQDTPVHVRRARVENLIALMMSPRVLGELSTKLGIRATPAELQRLIEVEAVTPEVLRIRATAGSSELATEMVNGLASTFVQFYGDLSTTAIEESIRLLNEQEVQARKELENRKAAVQKYKASRGISSLSDQLNSVMGRLTNVRQAREGTRAQLAELQAQLKEVDAQIARMPEVVRVVEKSNDSPAAVQLRSEIAVLEKDLALERGTHTEQHPRVQELKAKLASTTARLRQEQGQLMERVRFTANPDLAGLQQRRRDLRTQCDGLVAKIGSFDASVRSLQQEIDSYAGADVQLATLMQRYSMAEQRYQGLAVRLRQAQSNADTIRHSSAITIVDTAGRLNPPVDISKGKTKKLTAAAFVLSLVMVVFILAAWDYLDRRVRTSADAEALVELPVAGIIPRALPRAASTPLPQLTALMPMSPEGEAYRFLSLQLLLSRDSPVRVLMMATAKPGQGATTTISNLAATLAQGGRRVVLVDADLRRPSLHTIFQTPNEVGLTSILTEGLPVDQVVQPTLVPNLVLIPSGPPVENPWALLRSPAMEELVQQLRETAHFVLIDTPSAAAFADAYNVAPLADGAFMVVRSRHQPTGLELKIKRMFEEAGVKVFGAVLNDVPMSHVESCRYHADYYSREPRLEKHAEVPALTAGPG
jgi:succinoglycan biosynthesis transport protein ExoP